MHDGWATGIAIDSRVESAANRRVNRDARRPLRSFSTSLHLAAVGVLRLEASDRQDWNRSIGGWTLKREVDSDATNGISNRGEAYPRFEKRRMNSDGDCRLVHCAARSVIEDG